MDAAGLQLSQSVTELDLWAVSVLLCPPLVALIGTIIYQIIILYSVRLELATETKNSSGSVTETSTLVSLCPLLAAGMNAP